MSASLPEWRKLRADAYLPEYANPKDSGFDFRAVENDVVPYGTHKLIKTGLSIVLPDFLELQVRSKSGLTLNEGITVYNSPGTVDASYIYVNEQKTAEIGIIYANYGLPAIDKVITKGDKIGQGIFVPVYRPDQEVPVIDEAGNRYSYNMYKQSTDSRNGSGFGSTGK